MQIILKRSPCVVAAFEHKQTFDSLNIKNTRYIRSLVPAASMNQESRPLDEGGYTPSVLHRQDSEIVTSAKQRPSLLDSVKMPLKSGQLVGT